MATKHRLFDRRRMLLLVSLTLTLGFMTISALGYLVSRHAIRSTIIEQDLPLTSSNIYAEVQKDLVPPILISATMAGDTFLRDWVIDGERDVQAMSRYLGEIRTRFGAVSSFFISDRTLRYYTGDGVLKTLSLTDPRDAWYGRVRAMKEPYEINVDPDEANANTLTVFINYRVYDFDGNYLGVTGIGLTVDAVRKLIDRYQQRYQRAIYFVDAQGRTVSFADSLRREERDLRKAEGLGDLIDEILRKRQGLFEYEAGGDTILVDVNYLNDLKWYLFVEQNQDQALSAARTALLSNLLIGLLVTVIVVALVRGLISAYQERVETLATTDQLTGTYNRHAFTILADKMLGVLRRDPRPVSLLMVDLDHFKSINDRFGHPAGDDVLRAVAERLKSTIRDTDVAVRWGGEEFLVMLQGCRLEEAHLVAQKLLDTMRSTPIQAGRTPITVTGSIGVAEYVPGEPPATTIDRVDAAVYTAKHQGRNQVVVASATGAAAAA